VSLQMLRLAALQGKEVVYASPFTRKPHPTPCGTGVITTDGNIK
jgi:hypothetical protein